MRRVRKPTEKPVAYAMRIRVSTLELGRECKRLYYVLHGERLQWVELLDHAFRAVHREFLAEIRRRGLDANAQVPERVKNSKSKIFLFTRPRHD